MCRKDQNKELYNCSTPLQYLQILIQMCTDNLIHMLKHLFERKTGGIHDDGVRSRFQRRFSTVAVALVAVTHLAHQIDQSGFTHLGGCDLRARDLAVTAIAAYFRSRIEKDLHLGIGKYC